MRVRCLLFAAASILLVRIGSVSAAPTGGDAALSMKTSVDSVSVINDNSDGNRFLRITEKAKDAEAKSESEYDSDDDTEDEERGIQDLVRRVSYNTLDDVAGDLAGVPGAAKYLNGQNDELLKTIAARKWTPETMKAELGIAAKNTKRGSTDLGQWKPIAD